MVIEDIKILHSDSHYFINIYQSFRELLLLDTHIGIHLDPNRGHKTGCWTSYLPRSATIFRGEFWRLWVFPCCSTIIFRFLFVTTSKILIPPCYVYRRNEKSFLSSMYHFIFLEIEDPDFQWRNSYALWGDEPQAPGLGVPGESGTHDDTSFAMNFWNWKPFMLTCHLVRGHPTHSCPRHPELKLRHCWLHLCILVKQILFLTNVDWFVFRILRS